MPKGAMKNRIPNGYQFFPASLTGASNVLAMALLPNAISATKTGRQTMHTINTYKSTKAAPPPWEALYAKPQRLPSPTALPAAARINPSLLVHCSR